MGRCCLQTIRCKEEIKIPTGGGVTPLLQVQKEESLKKLSLILNFEF